MVKKSNKHTHNRLKMEDKKVEDIIESSQEDKLLKGFEEMQARQEKLLQELESQKKQLEEDRKAFESEKKGLEGIIASGKAPGIRIKALREKKKEELKPYYIENRKCPGTKIEFFAGDSPLKGLEQMHDTVKKYSIKDRSIELLPESLYYHMKEKGVMKPIIEENDRGELADTGRKYLDKRFDIHPVSDSDYEDSKKQSIG